jgi:hypothetical protein
MQLWNLQCHAKRMNIKCVMLLLAFDHRLCIEAPQNKHSGVGCELCSFGSTTHQHLMTTQVALRVILSSCSEMFVYVEFLCVCVRSLGFQLWTGHTFTTGVCKRKVQLSAVRRLSDVLEKNNLYYRYLVMSFLSGTSESVLKTNM